MKKIAIILSIYFLVWVVLYETPVYNQTDSLWNIYSSVSLADEGNLDLIEYKELFPKVSSVNLVFVGPHAYNYYPYGISILALPYMWITNTFYKLQNKSLAEKIIATSTIKFEKNISSSLLSMAACFFFLISFKITESYAKSFLLVFIFSFCTIIFSCISRGLWQHSGSIFLHCLTIFLLIRNKPGFLIISAFPLFFSYIVRPTNIVPLFIISLYICIQLKRKSFYFLLIGLTILSIFFINNQILFGSFIHPYYDFRKVAGSTTFYEALIANLISPGRGLFIYSPIFVFSLIGIFLKRKNSNLELLDYTFLSIVITHWFFTSRNLNWWGGHCYGYRLFSDMIPFIIYYLPHYLKYSKLNQMRFEIILFWIFLSLSFYINLKGAISMETYFWNLLPTNIDEHPSRNWEWRDPPFGR